MRIVRVRLTQRALNEPLRAQPPLHWWVGWVFRCGCGWQQVLWVEQQPCAPRRVVLLVHVRVDLVRYPQEVKLARDNVDWSPPNARRRGK